MVLANGSLPTDHRGIFEYIVHSLDLSSPRILYLSREEKEREQHYVYSIQGWLFNRWSGKTGDHSTSIDNGSDLTSVESFKTRLTRVMT
jgi:hypothetical protein